jgi:hypothetical protein
LKTARKWILTVATVLWVTSLGMWCALAWIEFSALHQPEAPTAEYQSPHWIKGKTRYFTTPQDRIHSVAEPTFFATVAAGFVLGGIHSWLDRRIKDTTVQRALERDPNA